VYCNTNDVLYFLCTIKDLFGLTGEFRVPRDVFSHPEFHHACASVMQVWQKAEVRCQELMLCFLRNVMHAIEEKNREGRFYETKKDPEQALLT
jgi:hypothetical protein